MCPLSAACRITCALTHAMQASNTFGFLGSLQRRALVARAALPDARAVQALPSAVDWCVAVVGGQKCGLCVASPRLQSRRRVHVGMCL